MKYEPMQTNEERNAAIKQDILWKSNTRLRLTEDIILLVCLLNKLDVMASNAPMILAAVIVGEWYLSELRKGIT